MQNNKQRSWETFKTSAAIVIIIGILLALLHVAIATPQLTALHAAPVLGDNSQINLIILWVHIATAVPPLALGLVTFSSRIRKANPKVHRWVGTIYCVCIWCSALLGMLLASANAQGIFAKFGFGLLGFAWFFTTTQAYIFARKKNFVLHRRWMIRSFALTLAVVTVRPMFWWPPSFVPYDQWYQIVTWLCWVPNLIIGDFYARHTTISGNLKTS